MPKCLSAFLLATYTAIFFAALTAPCLCASAPRLVCDGPLFDFGETNNSTVVSHTFVLKNKGDAPVEIRRVRASCGCTTAVVSTNTIAPAAEAMVTVAFNLRGRKGFQRKGVTVESNDPDNPFLRLEIAGTADADLEILPRALHFGACGIGNLAEAHCDLQASASSMFHITGLQNNAPDQFIAHVVTNVPGRSYRLYVRPLKAELRRHETVLQLKTDHPRYGVLFIPVSVTLLGDLVVKPAVMNLFASETNRFAPRVFTVQSQSGADFRLLDVRFSLPGVKARLDTSADGRQRVIVQNLPVAETWNGKEMEIVTDCEEQGVLHVPIRVLPGT